MKWCGDRSRGDVYGWNVRNQYCCGGGVRTMGGGLGDFCVVGLDGFSGGDFVGKMS